MQNLVKYPASKTEHVCGEPILCSDHSCPDLEVDLSGIGQRNHNEVEIAARPQGDWHRKLKTSFGAHSDGVENHLGGSTHQAGRKLQYSSEERYTEIGTM